MKKKFLNTKRPCSVFIPIQSTPMVHPPLIVGVLMNLNYPDFPNDKFSTMVGLSSRFMLSLPVFGLLFRFWGLQSVDPVNLKRLLNEGKSVGIVPGGYEEDTITSPK